MSTSAPALSRRHRIGIRLDSLSGIGLLLVGLTVVLGLWTALAPRSHAQTPTDQSMAVTKGRQLFLQGCSTCHGINAEGGSQGPSLIGVGAAAAQFQLGTGRMPLAAPGVEAERKSPRYSQPLIDQLSAYIASLAPGPEVPTVDITKGDLARGGELFRLNCAQCHNFAGAGGALTGGAFAPPLDPATPQQIGEAVRTGPENMPVFGPQQISGQQLNDIAAYAKYIANNPDNRGGNGLGHIGPVPEGLVIWTLGIGAVLAATLWIGSRT